MAYRRRYIAPFWNLIALAVMKIVLVTVGYYNVRRLANLPDHILRSIVVTGSIIVSVLIAEAAVYWLFRRWQLKKLFVWLHIILLYLILIIVPVLYPLVMGLFNEISGTAPTYSMLSAISYLVQFLVWGGLGAAHIFFLGVIINGYRNRKNAMPEVETEFESI